MPLDPQLVSGSKPAPLRILMIHGYTQSGPLFRAKTRALEKKLLKAFPAGVSLVYPTAPIRLAPADIPGFSPLTSTTVSGEGQPESHDGDINKLIENRLPGSSDPPHSAPLETPQTGPIPETITETEIDAYGWWRRRGETEPYHYEGMEVGLRTLARTLEEEGPFDGVIGFSQGGSAAGLIASLLEPGRRQAFEEAANLRGGMKAPAEFWRERSRGAHAKDEAKYQLNVSKGNGDYASDIARKPEKAESKATVTKSPIQNPPQASNDEGSRVLNPSRYSNQESEPNDEIYEPIHPPLKFAVSYSGYGTLNPLYAGFFNPRIRTPMLHFIGSLDTVVEERRSLMLVDACDSRGKDDSKRVVYHPGGHFLPSSQKQLVDALVVFIKESMAEAEREEKHATKGKMELESPLAKGMDSLKLDNERDAHI